MVHNPVPKIEELGETVSEIAYYGFAACVIVFMLVVLAQTIFIVPANQFALIKRFDAYTGRVLTEGLAWKLPFIETYELEERKLDTAPFEMSIQSGDRQEIAIRGSVQYRPDVNNLERWVRIDDDTIRHGLIDKIESVIGEIVGENDADDFVGMKLAVGRLVVATLCMEEPPHIKAGLAKMGDILRFYRAHDVHGDEEELASRSGVEEQYGIEIEVLAITDISFNKAMEEARQKEALNKQMVKAARVIKDELAATIDQLRTAGLSPEAAATTARQVLGLPQQTGEQIVTLQNTSGGPTPLVVQHLDDPRTTRPANRSGRKDT